MVVLRSIAHAKLDDDLRVKRVPAGALEIGAGGEGQPIATARDLVGRIDQIAGATVAVGNAAAERAPARGLL